MEKDSNLPINVCASVLEKLIVLEAESEYDLQTVHDLHAPQGTIKKRHSFNVISSFDKTREQKNSVISSSSFSPTINIIKDSLPLELMLNDSGGSSNDAALKNVLLTPSIDDHFDSNKPAKKFNFLRKGQGTARYGSRKFIGFKKIKVNNINQCKVSPQKAVPVDSLKNFEELEELVEHPSFISTSSEINNLLQANDSLSLTPLRENPKKSKLQNILRTPGKPNRNIFECLKQQKKPFDKKTNNSVLTNQTSSLQQDHFCNANNYTDTPKLNKVHFPEPGIEVLEYKNETINTSSTVMLDDSDLATFSDLEGLVDVNMQNLIKSIYIPNNDKSTIYLDPNTESTTNDVSRNFQDIKTLKNLLTSKIQSLNKEIQAFKDINECLQVQTEEVKEEKQNYIEMQNKKQNKLNCSCCQKKVLPSITHSKMQNNTEKIISRQLCELTASMRSMHEDIQQIRSQKNKPKAFCNLKLLSKPNHSVGKTANNAVNGKQTEPKSTMASSTAHSSTSIEKIYKHVEDASQCNDSIAAFEKSSQDSTCLRSKTKFNSNINYSYDNNKKHNDIGDPPERCFEANNKSLIHKLPEHVTTSDCADTFVDGFSCLPIIDQPVLCNFHHSSNYKKYDDKIEYFFPNHSIITKYKDGKEVRVFENGQTETYFPDESYEIIYSDKSVRSVYSDGTDIFIAVDGTTKTIQIDGSISIKYPNRQREDYKDGKVQRSYPDGTIKILYPNGNQETVYSNGKIRIKDRHGKLLS